MARLLVTGATGFVGQHLIPALMRHYTVIAAVRREQPNLPCEQIVVGDIHDQTDWSKALENVEIVVHLAARVHVMKEASANPLAAFARTNVDGTRHLAEQAAAHHVKRFVFLSSIKVNGEETPAGQHFSEASVPHPSDPYALSKWQAELALQAVSRETDLEIVILRPPLIYGPGVRANFYRLMQLANRKMPLPFGSVSNQRSFIYIENLVSAIMAVLYDPRAKNRTFLVADDEAWSLTELFQELRGALNRPRLLFPIPGNWMKGFCEMIGLSSFAQRLFSSLKVSNASIKQTLEWQPPVTAEQGLKQTINWYQNADA